MTTRYFKSTDGTRTIFRATALPQGYRFGVIGGHRLGFTNVPQNGAFPAHEITKAEFEQLIALKQIRTAGQRYATSPQDSWVFNTAIPLPFVPTAEELERINNPGKGA